MNKKSKRLYNRMQHGINKRKEEVTALENKRKSIESEEKTVDKKKKTKK